MNIYMKDVYMVVLQYFLIYLFLTAGVDFIMFAWKGVAIDYWIMKKRKEVLWDFYRQKMQK